MLKEEILTYLQALHQELQITDIRGEICLYGGAVMCLVYHARPSTKDVDAVFEPTQAMRDAIKQVAEQYHLSEDWLNDGVKGFLTQYPKRVFLDWPYLTIYVAEPDYLLAMKALACRVDGTNNPDIRFLIRTLGITSVDDVFKLIEKYYPHHQIKPATQFFLEEVFETL